MADWVGPETRSGESCRWDCVKPRLALTRSANGASTAPGRRFSRINCHSEGAPDGTGHAETMKVPTSPSWAREAEAVAEPQAAFVARAADGGGVAGGVGQRAGGCDPARERGPGLSG